LKTSLKLLIESFEFPTFGRGTPVPRDGTLVCCGTQVGGH